MQRTQCSCRQERTVLRVRNSRRVCPAYFAFWIRFRADSTFCIVSAISLNSKRAKRFNAFRISGW